MRLRFLTIVGLVAVCSAACSEDSIVSGESPADVANVQDQVASAKDVAAALPDTPGTQVPDAAAADAQGPDTAPADAAVLDIEQPLPDGVPDAGTEDMAVDALTVELPWLHPPGTRGICDPCAASADCADPTASCVGLGAPAGASGMFCQAPCGPDFSCPEGAECTQRDTPDGTLVLVCLPSSGKCGCSDAAAKGGWTTPCYVPSIDKSGLVVGKCGGTWTCGAGGCDAASPATETCNGADDDCDGKTDEMDGADLCDDGNPCTVGEACVAGKCQAGTNQCSCQTDANCALQDACQGKWICDKATLPWHCAPVAGSAPDCSKLSATACTTPGCDIKTGACVNVPKVPGTACDADGSNCTVGDACVGSVCKAGPTISCDDGNPCTFDACGAKGCGHTNTVGACDDGNACTASDTCKQGSCVGTAKGCSDGDPCTADACDPKTGGCVATPADGGSCDDANPCTTAETCVAGKCVGSKSVSCDDNNPCTEDSCQGGKGCQHEANEAPCEDGNACTKNDVCANGKCQGGASSCGCEDQADCDAKQAADPCLGALVCNLAAAVPTCVPKTGASPVCPAAGPCQVAVCDKGACSTAPVADGKVCDDGQVCTSGDTCSGGKCVGVAAGCDDGNPCTVDSCAISSGGAAACNHAAGAGSCSDGNACTQNDGCIAGKCVPGAAMDCNDGSACTVDACNPKTGACSHDFSALQGKTCSTGQGACGPATCAGALCLSASATPCDDGNPCTTDSCAPDVGCQHVANTAPCNDSNVCTTTDQCAAGKCAGTGKNLCDDGNACTDDSCALPAGCQHVFNTAPCDDGDKCTVSDTCAAGACTTQKMKCGDGNPCTSSTCTAGVCSAPVNVADGTACKGKGSCVGQATCAVGVCVDLAENCPNKKGREIVPLTTATKPGVVTIPATFAAAQTLFDPYGFHEVKLEVAPADWAKYLALVAKVQQTNTWFQAKVTFDGKDYGTTGIRPFGFGSLFTNPQKPNIRVKFDAFLADKTGPDDVHSLRFKPSGQDRTWLKQILGPVIVQQSGGYAPRYSFARLWVNGQPYGLYQMMEHVDKHFYKVNFDNNDGNEYQRSKSCMGLNCPGGVCANLKGYYIGDPGDVTEVVDLGTIVQSEPAATWPTKLAARTDLESLYAQYAWEAISSDIDTLAAAGQNYTMYVNMATAKIEFIPTGQDLICGLNGAWYDLWKPWGPPNTWCNGRVDNMYTRIVATPELKAEYLKVVQQQHCGFFAPKTFLAVVAAYKKLLWTDLTQDPKGVFTAAQFEKAYTDLINYVNNRYAYLNTTVGPCP